MYSPPSSDERDDIDTKRLARMNNQNFASERDYKKNNRNNIPLFSEPLSSNLIANITAPRDKSYTGGNVNVRIPGKEHINGATTNKSEDAVVKHNRESNPTTRSYDNRNADWNCSFCTYLNESAARVCNMCDKTRATAVPPLKEGGRQCSQCTLVNDAHNERCTACDSPMEGASTYI